MKVKVVKVRTRPPYEILIGDEIFGHIALDLKENFNFGKAAIITDSNVKTLYGERLLSSLKEAGLKAEIFSFQAGEASKTIDTIYSLSRNLAQANFDRKDLILALGGGVVGDIAGFLASIYLRGIPYVQIPTTLLAQVDSSVGGKTGVDLPEGKNLVGTFYQPTRVYIDPSALETLPDTEFKNGLAEVIKYACTLRPRLFSYLERYYREVLNRKKDALLRIIYESCKAKADVVSKDEKEGGLRMVLNFGHTLGHALEAYAQYGVLHGFCVSVGMVFAIKLSERLGLAKPEVAHRLENLLKLYGLPTNISELRLSLKESELAGLLSFIERDKKVWKGKLTMILLKDIGDFVFYVSPPLFALESAIHTVF